MQLTHVVSALILGHFEVAILWQVYILDLGWVSHVEVQLVLVEAEPLHFVNPI